MNLYIVIWLLIAADFQFGYSLITSLIIDIWKLSFQKQQYMRKCLPLAENLSVCLPVYLPAYLPVCLSMWIASYGKAECQESKQISFGHCSIVESLCSNFLMKGHTPVSTSDSCNELDLLSKWGGCGVSWEMWFNQRAMPNEGNTSIKPTSYNMFKVLWCHFYFQWRLKYSNILIFFVVTKFSVESLCYLYSSSTPVLKAALDVFSVCLFNAG